jgi:hypothetical protein
VFLAVRHSFAAATMNHNYTKDMMIGLAVGFMILPVVFVALRIWAKVLSKRLAWDDYLTFGALVGYKKNVAQGHLYADFY